MTSNFQRALFVLLLSLFSLAARADKTDVIYFHNGDRVTGEIKSLERGKLEVSTDHMGTVLIDWEDILEVSSTTGQVVELTNGQRFYGPLSKADSTDMVQIETAQGAVGLNTLDVVTMYPVEAGFWDRLDVSASVGFSWDKGSSVGKYNIGVDAQYRNPRFITNASFTSEITTQEDSDNTSRAALNANHLVFRRNKRYHAIFGNMEQNDELGVDLRALFGAGYGVVPLRTQSKWLVIGAGLAVNHEIPAEGQEETNLEAVGTLNFDYYRYSSPERSFKTALNVFPSLTDAGRWRANLDTSLSLEFIADLFWRLSLYASYDSDPLSADASKSDYGITSSLAYKF